MWIRNPKGGLGCTKVHRNYFDCSVFWRSPSPYFRDSDKLYSYVLNKPHKVTATKPILLTEDVDNERNVEITLSPWILLTEDKEMTVPREWVITIVNPIESIVQM